MLSNRSRAHLGLFFDRCAATLQVKWTNKHVHIFASLWSFSVDLTFSCAVPWLVNYVQYLHAIGQTTLDVLSNIKILARTCPVWMVHMATLHKRRILKNVLVTLFYAITVNGDWGFWEPDHSDPWMNHFTNSAKRSHPLWMNHSFDSHLFSESLSSSYRSEWFVHNWSGSQVQLTDSKLLNFNLFLKQIWLQRAKTAWCIILTTFMMICFEAWKHNESKILFNEIA